jgi:ribokinase
VSEVVLKKGEAGAWVGVRESSKLVKVPACPARAVDTTGAGDVFNGYYLASRLQGFAPFEAAEWASCAAAIQVSRPGSVSAIPSREEVERLLTSYRESRPRAD